VNSAKTPYEGTRSKQPNALLNLLYRQQHKKQTRGKYLKNKLIYKIKNKINNQ